MDDADRFRLLGTYRTSRFRIGQRVRCLVRGEVVITEMVESLILSERVQSWGNRA